MANLILLIMTLLLSSCAKTEAESTSFTFQTEAKSNGMLRLENDEVICYRWEKGGVSCKFKD